MHGYNLKVFLFILLCNIHFHPYAEQYGYRHDFLKHFR